MGHSLTKADLSGFIGCETRFAPAPAGRHPVPIGYAAPTPV
jgi:hypothetical protein